MPLMSMPLSTFGEEDPPYGDITSCKVPSGRWSVWFQAMMMLQGLGREKHSSYHSPARALAIGRTIRGSDDLASACRKWLPKLQGRSHTILDSFLSPSYSYLASGILQIYVEFSSTQNSFARRQFIGRQRERRGPFRTLFRAD